VTAGRQPETVVLLDRIEPGVTPPYCTHGRATCVGGCGEWVWLGHATAKAVTGGAAPLCMECARRLIPAGTGPVTNIRDHRRADGPHG